MIDLVKAISPLILSLGLLCAPPRSPLYADPLEQGLKQLLPGAGEALQMLSEPLADHRLPPQSSAQLTQLDFSPDRVIWGRPLKQLYQEALHDRAHQLTAAHLWLVKSGRLRYESEALKVAMSEPYFRAQPYFDLRFRGLLAQYGHKSAPSSGVIGFWLQRELLGDRAALWSALRAAMSALDPEGLQGLLVSQPEEMAQVSYDAPLSDEQRASVYRALLSAWASPAQREPHQLKLGELWLEPYRGGLELFTQTGALIEALSALLAPSERSLSPLKLIKRLTQRELLQSSERDGRGRRGLKPHRYNPSLLLWGFDQLIPPAQLELDGVSAQALYQAVARDFTRQLIDCYLYLHKKRDPKVERFELSMRSLDASFDGLAYLKARYNDAPSLRGGSPGWPLVGFWLRRSLDETAPLIWGGLRLVVCRFDPEYCQLSAEAL